MPKRKNDHHPIQNILQPNETIYWIGQPNPTKFFSKQDIFLIPFTIFWSAITYAFVFGMLTTMVFPMNLVVLLLPHFWVALILFPGRFIYSYYSRHHTTYAVTDKHLIVYQGLFSDNYHTFDIHHLPELGIHAKKNHSGTIMFNSGVYTGKQKRNQQHHFHITGFHDIADVWDVYHLIQSLQSQADNITEPNFLEDNTSVYDMKRNRN